MIVKKAVIQDVCSFVGGSQPPKSVFSSVYKDGYIRFIQIRDYKTKNFITYIPTNMARRFCNKEDIMIGRYGPPIFQILKGIEGAYNVALMKAVPKQNIHNDYLYYLLKQESIFKYVDNLSPRTGGQTGVDLFALNKYPILLPDKLYQQKVVSVLKSLDSKIELNRQIDMELNKMAKLIYDYWFVQFDFPDKNSKPYKSNGGKMVWNKEIKRDIPEGWEANTLGDLVGIKRGKNITRKTIVKGEIPVIAAGIEPSCYHNVANTNKPVVTISGSGANAGFVKLHHKNIWASDCSYIDANISEFVYLYYLFLSRRQKELFNMQKGSAQPHVYPNDLMRLKIAYSKDAFKKFTDKVTPLFARIRVLKQESAKLSELRNWLLPMFMNGQVKVSRKFN